MTDERMPEPRREALTEDQRKAWDEFQRVRGTPVFGPYIPLSRSPELMACAHAVGRYLRYRSPLDRRLAEFATLLAAREWSQDYEWAVHHPIALQAGLEASVADAVRDGRRPDDMAEDEAVLYDFVAELSRTKQVSDPTYSRAVTMFGEQGVIDIVAIQGFYGWLAMTMNVARVALPNEAVGLPRFPG